MQAQIQKNADQISQAQPTQAQPTQAQPTQATTEGATTMTIQNIIESLAQEGKFTATKLDLSVSVNGFDIKVKAKNVEITTTAKPTQSATATATSTADTDDLISFKAFSKSVSKSMQSVADRIAPNTFIIGAEINLNYYCGENPFAEIKLNTNHVVDPILDICTLNIEWSESDYAHLGEKFVYAVRQIESSESNHSKKLLTTDDWFKLTFEGSKEEFFKGFEEHIKSLADQYGKSIEGIRLLAESGLVDGGQLNFSELDIFEIIDLENGVRIGNQLVKATEHGAWGCVPYDFEIINLK